MPLFRQARFFGSGFAGLLLCLASPRVADQRLGAAARRPHFTDVAGRSAFTYITNNNDTGRKYFQQPMCGGIGVLDFDNDGLMDIFFSNGAELPSLRKSGPAYYQCLLRNRGDGTFQDVTAKAKISGEHLDFSYGVAVGDYDNDGFSDIFIANTGANTLYHNNGDGTFTDVTLRSGIGGKPPETLSVQGAWFDYDNDGRLDLLVSNYTLWSRKNDRRCTIGGVEAYCHPRMYPPVPSRLYRNLGDGKFEDVTEKAGLAKFPGRAWGSPSPTSTTTAKWTLSSPTTPNETSCS